MKELAWFENDITFGCMWRTIKQKRWPGHSCIVCAERHLVILFINTPWLLRDVTRYVRKSMSSKNFSFFVRNFSSSASWISGTRLDRFLFKMIHRSEYTRLYQWYRGKLRASPKAAALVFCKRLLHRSTSRGDHDIRRRSSGTSNVPLMCGDVRLTAT